METLPRRASGGLEEIIHRYQNTVFGLALAKTGSRVDAEDVFQEVFLAYYQSGKPFADEEHRKAWLLRTTLNLCKRVTGSAWRRRTAPLEEAGEGSVPFQSQEENEVWQAVSQLAEEYRVPIYLFYFQELSTREIARALGIREGAARMRLLRGRERLRELLKGDYFDGSEVIS